MTLDNSNITYERLLYSNTGEGVEGAGLDITTGVFTAPYSAVWTVTYSATSVQYDGDIIQARVILYHWSRSIQRLSYELLTDVH